jgi:phytanoyl-CoA hydroxylase
VGEQSHTNNPAGLGTDWFETLLRDGFVVVPQAVSDDLCVTATADLDKFKSRNRRVIAPNLDSSDRLSRVVNLHLVIDSLASLFSTNGALAVCDAFFDGETVLYTSLYFERGSEQDLHRDSPLFVTKPEGKYLGVWVALEDVDGDNGPLMVVPKSHALPKIDVEAIGRDLYGDLDSAPAQEGQGWDAYQGAVKKQSEQHALAPIEVHVRRGDVIVWHPLLFHGGAAHHSTTRTRRSLVMHVTPMGVPVYHQDVFFNPGKDVPSQAAWDYYDHGGRKIAEFHEVDFAHQFQRRVDRLQRPDAGVSERVGVVSRRLKHRLGAALRGAKR